jgi:uncharacterized protein (DUF2249 family)
VDGSDLPTGLVRTLTKACRALAEAGRPQDAGRLAADAWVLVRHARPDLARRLDGTMHHVARLEQQLEATAPRPEVPMTTPDRIIDVRPEIPRIRHELIFTSFDELPVDTAFVLVNDHDPKPLYYQLAAENAGQFTWEYLEEGPEVWRVRIGRVAES